MKIPIESDKQQRVQIKVLMSSLNQLADIFPGELSKAG
jgi:hypothetical protein